MTTIFLFCRLGGYIYTNVISHHDVTTSSVANFGERRSQDVMRNYKSCAQEWSKMPPFRRLTFYAPARTVRTESTRDCRIVKKTNAE